MTKPLILNCEQSRRVDVLAVERYGMTGLVLMENAGRGAAEITAGILGAPRADRPVVICCGRGNNGGDGFVMARHLNNRGFAVWVLLFCDPAKLTGDAASNFEIARRADLPIDSFPADVDSRQLAERLAGASCIVDALLGTGATGEPRAPYDQVIDAINAQPAPVAAVDVPSGLDCDTGQPTKHTVRADHTITFVAPKPGFFTDAARPYVGELHIVDIGVPRKLLAEFDAA